MTVYAQFYRGGKGKPSVLTFCTEAGQLVAKTLGFLRHHSQLLSLPTCSLLKYVFCTPGLLADLLGKFIAVQAPSLTDRWMIALEFGMHSCSSQLPSLTQQRPCTEEYGAELRPPQPPWDSLASGSRCCCSSADLGVPGTDCQLCHLPTCSTPHVESELLRVGPSICMSKKLP